MRTSRGFTLMEILIVFGIMLLLLGLSAVFSSQTLRNVEFNRARETARNELMTAQADTMAGTFDSAWGVKFSTTTNSIIRYKARSATETGYAYRDTYFDATTTFGNSVTINPISGVTDIPFIRPKGFPSATTTVSIKISDDTNNATITINTLGAITIQ